MRESLKEREREIKEGVGEIPYSRKIWRALNLADWPQPVQCEQKNIGGFKFGGRLTGLYSHAHARTGVGVFDFLVGQRWHSR